MTTGEKITFLRKKKKITQEQLSEILNVSRQSVSRWEMDVAFPETEKLIRLSKLFDCSIDYLLNNEIHCKEESQEQISAQDCCTFIRECGYYFIATSTENNPKIRPMGMIYANENALYLVSDKRKSLYGDVLKNPKVELVACNARSHRWIRIHGVLAVENSIHILEEIESRYLNLKHLDQEAELNRVILWLAMEQVDIH